MLKLTPTLLHMTLVGAEWVLWLLLVLSLLSIALLLERALYFSGLRFEVDELIQKIRLWLREKDVEAALDYLKKSKSVEAEVVAAGLREHARGPAAMEDAMLAAKIRVRVRLEKNLSFLGTLGSNAPFIGLFGTVLGIIKAFQDLSQNQNPNAGIQVIMSGISEALIATAVGLFVAIPAVVGFNFYNRLVRRRMSQVEATIQDVLAAVYPEKASPAKGAA